jgi:methionine-rich copper-binding protein CopC
MKSSPAANSTVNGPDLHVNLRFNVRVDSSRSKLRLLAADGSSTSVVIAKQSNPDTLQGTVTALKAGAYKLQWNVLASDGHMSRGEIPFTVK